MIFSKNFFLMCSLSLSFFKNEERLNEIELSESKISRIWFMLLFSLIISLVNK